MALQSQLFRGDPKLEAAAVSDPAHIFQGARGPHVAKIQQALNQLDRAALATDGVFGPATAAAVYAFKKKRSILNYLGKLDAIVGKKTTAALDRELSAQQLSPHSCVYHSTFSARSREVITGFVVADDASDQRIINAAVQESIQTRRQAANALNSRRPPRTSRILRGCDSLHCDSWRVGRCAARQASSTSMSA